MKGSFVRKSPAATADPGTRPGLHGQTLISMGLVDLDKLLGGGLPLGSLVLVLEDEHSQQHANIMKYFMAEGVTIGQQVMWLAATLPQGGAEEFLPAIFTGAASSQADNKEKEDTEPELRIAWQYRKYIVEKQKEEASSSSGSGSSRSTHASSLSSKRSGGSLAAGIAKEWCNTFDLPRAMGPAPIQKSGMVSQPCAGQDGLQQTLQEALGFVARVRAAIGGGASTSTQQQGSPTPSLPSSSTGSVAAAAAVAAVGKGPQTVGRLVIQSLCSPAWMQQDVADSARQAVQLVFRLRQALQDSRCAAMITCPAGLLPPSTSMQLQHMCDAVLALGTISDDSEVFRLLPDAASAAALLSLHKLPSAGMVVPRLADPTLYVVRHKRRRITITPVEVDPDAESKHEQAAGGVARPASSAHSASLEF